jgi:hypothetical protein
MSEDKGDPTAGEGDSDRGHDGMTDDAAMKGDLPSPQDSAESSGEDQAAIDLEAVRDRAS